MFAGWHGLATAGHLLTLMSVLFFFITLADSRFSRILVSNNKPNGVVRFYKRLSFYFFKIDKKQSYRDRLVVFKYIS